MCSLDCKTVGFLLKISKAIGKAWRKSLTRGKRASLNARRACEARGKKPTVRYPYNGFRPGGSKMSTIGQKSVHHSTLFVNLIHPVIDFDFMAEVTLGIFIVNHEVYNLVASEARVYHTSIARRRKASVISY